MSEPVVECRKLNKIYHQGHVEVPALVDVDLSVSKGEFAALCGPSGSGKSTLLNLLSGLDIPTSGEITLEGKRLDQMDRGQLAELRLQRIGFVFQAYNLIPVLSAQENVEFVMQLQGMSGTKRNQRAREVLAEVGLQGLEDRRPGDLSGGQQQRVAVARAIASEPALIFADEPTANLDSHTAESLMEMLAKMNQERGVTFVFSTHDQRVMDHAGRIVHLRDGRIEDVPQAETAT